ncbi:Na(+)/H(+) antiporter subunit C [Aquipuribacter sp. MA13-6]|uniref:Na(+)/H(+) antiporter subunit C n=1 Tax=unclassified Aquipuribacter TaxID=2635084 RepID=UPI003EE96338
MTANAVYLVLVAVLFSTGVYLVLDRSLTRVLLGVLLISNGVNVLILSVSGPAGGPPIVGVTPFEDMSDPLPQALILTAIVITLGVASFFLALTYRSWVLDSREDVVDDDEDVRVALQQRLEDSDSEVYGQVTDDDEPDDTGTAGTGRTGGRPADDRAAGTTPW